MALRILLAVLTAVGVVIFVDAGWGGLAVYLFFVGVVAAFSTAIGGGGDLIRDASRRRHDRRP